MGLNSGDLLFFAGKGPVSTIIKVGSFGRFSHVGIIGKLHGRPLLYESTSFERPTCVRTGKLVCGVQAHWPEELIGLPDSDTYHVPLRRQLYHHEEERLFEALDCAVGKRYDMRSAITSGGLVLKLLAAILKREDRNSLFCSELCAAMLSDIGVFDTRSASKWSPNSLYRALRWRGLVEPARRIYPK